MEADRNLLRLLCGVLSWALSVSASAQEPNPTLTAVEGNVALDLGAYTCSPEPVCSSNTSYSGMVYHEARHRMMVFGGGHAATYRDDVDVFDLDTLTWSPAYPPTPCEEMTLDNVDVDAARWISSNHPIARHTYDLLAVAGEDDELWMLSKVQGRGRGCTSLPSTDEGAPYVIADGRFAAYDPDTRSWRYTDTPSVGFKAGVETDPVTGRIVLLSNEEMGTIDPADGSYSRHLTVLEPDLASGAGLSLVYFPPNDRFYAFVQSKHEDGVFELQLDRADPARSTVRRLTSVDPPSAPVRDAWAYDPRAQLIGGGVEEGMFFAFDPIAERWHERRMVSSDEDLEIGSVDGKALAHDPVNGVYVFRTDWRSGRRTWAYRWGAPSGGDGGVADAGAGDADGGDAGAADGGVGDAGALRPAADASSADATPGAPGSPPPGARGGCQVTPASTPATRLACWGALALLALARRRRRSLNGA